MKAPLQAAALIVLTAAATTAVVLPVATATAQQSTVSSAPTPVAGLPDFSQLVEQVGPGVVSVSAEIGGGASPRSRAAQQQDIPEIFRRFFGPDGFPFPDMPDRGARPRGESMGSGFIISSDGYVLTNHHVVDGASEVKVKLSDGREFKAKVVGSDEQSDVALLKIDAKGLPALRIGNSDALKPGQWAIAIGSPFGLDHSVTAGIISAVGRNNRFTQQQYVPFIQTDVAINQGNSGGPLLNAHGEVIGINSQIFSNSGGYMGVSFAIPIDLAMGAVKQLKETGKVRRGMIGVTLQEIDAETARGLGLPDTHGALVNDVTPGSAGEKAGLRVGDVIRSIDGNDIRQWSELPPIVGNKTPGTKVELGVLRDGKTRSIPVTLGELDPGLLPGASRQSAPGGARGPADASANPLGLVGQELDADDRRQAGLESGEGVGIARIDGAAAREAGLAPGDIVLRVGGTTVGSVQALDRALAGVKPGQTVMLLVRRGSMTRFFAVTPRADGN
ncbi:DegQ family serine endoprotease [Luteimonas lutimaris]|uniref:Probable periplasmic serine endoprotease DegP-like n=1 Tax=Luteimonas lutimaris TaxID=698645 RepID=A0ABP7MH30_9GAMM|nr:DegQ family serine endoprotease [Luteimonas sp.]